MSLLGSNSLSPSEQLNLFFQAEQNYAYGFINEKNSPFLKELKSEKGQKLINILPLMEAACDPKKNKAADAVLLSSYEIKFDTLTQPERDEVVKATINAFLKTYGFPRLTTLPITVENDREKKEVLDEVRKKLQKFTTDNYTATVRQEVATTKKIINGYVSAIKWNTALKVLGYFPFIGTIIGIIRIILALINIHKINHTAGLLAKDRKFFLKINRKALERGIGELFAGFVFIPVDIYKSYKTNDHCKQRPLELPKPPLYEEFQNFTDRIKNIAANGEEYVL